jgi:hypothetical protein
LVQVALQIRTEQDHRHLEFQFQVEVRAERQTNQEVMAHLAAAEPTIRPMVALELLDKDLLEERHRVAVGAVAVEVLAKLEIRTVKDMVVTAR